MIQRKFYSNNVWKQKSWQKNVPKVDVEQTECNERFYPYL